MKAYYAHPLSLYNSAQEVRDVQTIQSLGFEVLNPNAAIHNTGYKAKGMEYFVELIRDCEICIFRAFPDGNIPAGIVKEIDAFRNLSRPVLELPNGIVRRALSVDATREYLKEIGNR